MTGAVFMRRDSDGNYTVPRPVKGTEEEGTKTPIATPSCSR